MLLQQVCFIVHPWSALLYKRESVPAQETQQTLQAATASLLGRFAAQPLHGPRVMLLLNKLLPPGLAAAVRDGPGALAIMGLAVASQLHDTSVSQLVCPMD